MDNYIKPESKLYRPSIEINLTDHCNLKCANCDHASNLLPEHFISVEQVLQDLDNMADILHAGEIKLLGGEPLLHPNIIEIAKIVKESMIADEICIFTNGTLIDKVSEELWQYIDGIYISIYPGIKYKFDEKFLKNISNRHHMWIQIHPISSFNKTLLNKENTDKELVKFIYNRCTKTHFWSCHAIQEGYYYKCSVSAFMEKRLKMLGITFDKKNDCIHIINNSNLKNDLEKFISSSIPLNACSFCLGSDGQTCDHYQMNSQQINENKLEKDDNAHELLNKRNIIQNQEWSYMNYHE